MVEAMVRPIAVGGLGKHYKLPQRTTGAKPFYAVSEYTTDFPEATTG